MKTLFVIAFLVASISFVQCAQNQCYLSQCLASGATCYVAGSPSAACATCTNNLYACAGTGTDLCTCGNNFMDCILKNATDDKTNCNPTVMYQTCLSIASNCSCGNYNQNTPIPVCNQDDYCNNSTNKCTAKTGAGQTCYSSADCDSSYVGGGGLYNCVSGKCTLVDYTVSIGDSCKNDDDCVNANTGETSCVNMICVGQNAGGNCTDTSSCNFGLYCDNGVCAAELKEGATCDMNDDNCGYPTVCGTGDKCVKAFTKSKGAVCAVDYECMGGLACVNMVCANAPAAKACMNDTDCPVTQGYTGSCNCDSNTGKSMCTVASAFSTSCYNEVVSLYTCAMSNNCPTPDPASPCMKNNCQNEANCYENCGLALSGAPAGCYSTLTCTQGTTGSTGGSATVAASVGLAVVAAAALFA